ncbi:MAG: hypothetical protein LBU13_01850 [Synergistaceae bacterium]|nr:hypothetical protein [Synergistaceae bacterium]
MSENNILSLDEFTQGLKKAAYGDSETSAAQTETPERQSNVVVLRRICFDCGVKAFYPINVEGVFVRYPRKAHFEVNSVRSRRFRSWLSKKFLISQGTEAKSADIDSAIVLLEDDAVDEPRHEIFTRLAGHEGKIYVDLCNDEYEVIEVDGIGWRVIQNPSVWFARHQSMRPLPYPTPNGSLERLREFSNLSDEDFILFVSWIVSSANPDGPFLVLAISSEHGSGKSALSTVAKSILDPNSAMRLAPPKDGDAVFATASAQRVLIYDNLKKIDQGFSDVLCRLATGGTISKRALHTDNDVFSFSAKRPIILNGIAPSLGGLDLVSRTIQIRTLPISESHRLTESAFFAKFDEACPAIFGALLKAISCAIKMKDYTPCSLPRMADAAAFVIRAEAGGGLPWEEGTFFKTFTDKERRKEDEALEGDPVAAKIMLLSENVWKGSAKELLFEITKDLTAEEKKFVPQTPRGLSAKLLELAPLLRSRGIVCERSETPYLGHHHVTIYKTEPKEEDQKSAFSFLDR